jgi:hypothetical protein
VLFRSKIKKIFIYPETFYTFGYIKTKTNKFSEKFYKYRESSKHL